MTHKNAQIALDSIESLMLYASADVEGAIESASEGFDPKIYFAALQRLDVATRAAVQATTVLNNIIALQTAMVQSASADRPAS